MAVRIGIDTGGTFTDLIGIDDETGELVVAKTPSTPRRPVEAMMDAIEASGVPAGDDRRAQHRHHRRHQRAPAAATAPTSST